MSTISATEASSFVVAVDKTALSHNQSRSSAQEPHAIPTSAAASVHKTSDREPVDDIRVGLERKGMEVSFLVDPSSGRAQMVVLESGTGREVLKVPSDSALYQVLKNKVQSPL
jgi:uncharacterized FlaG/YvyC family protein